MGGTNKNHPYVVQNTVLCNNEISFVIGEDCAPLSGMPTADDDSGNDEGNSNNKRAEPNQVIFVMTNASTKEAI